MLHRFTLRYFEYFVERGLTMAEDKIIPFALVGLGRIGKKHLQAYKKLQKHFSLVAVIDSKPERAETICKEILGTRLSKKIFYYKRLLDVFKPENRVTRKNPRLISVCTPSASHYSLARLALENDCHVLLEKPMAMRSVDCQHLVHLAKQKKKHLAMAHIFRYMPLLTELRKDIKNEVFGSLLHGNVRVLWGHEQAYYDLSSWRGTWEKDGGALLNQSIHAVDLLHFLIDEQPVKAQAWLSQVNHILETEDLGFVTYHLQNNVPLSLLGTTASDPEFPSADLDLIFSHGRIQLRFFKRKMDFQILQGEGSRNRTYYIKHFLRQAWKKDALGRGFLSHLSEAFHPYEAIYNDVAQCILGYRESPLASSQDGDNACESIFAAYRSALLDSQVCHLPLNDFDCQEMRGFFEEQSVESWDTSHFKGK